MFAVKGELARTPTGLEDAAMMQAAENAVLGQAPRGEAAAVMQSASRRKGRLGVVPRDEATDAAADGWVAVTEARVPGFRVKHARSSWPTRCRPFRVDATVALNCLKPSVRTSATYVLHKMRCSVYVCICLSGRTPLAAEQQGKAVSAECWTAGSRITIGKALEATAFSAGDEPVEWRRATRPRRARPGWTRRTRRWSGKTRRGRVGWARPSPPPPRG